MDSGDHRFEASDGGEPGPEQLTDVYGGWCLNTKGRCPGWADRVFELIAQGNRPPCFPDFPYEQARIYWIITKLIQGPPMEKDINTALAELEDLAEDGFIPAAILHCEILLGMVDDLETGDTWRDDETGVIRALEILFWSLEAGHRQERRNVRIKTVQILTDYSLFYSEGHDETEIKENIRKLCQVTMTEKDDQEFVLRMVRAFVEWVTTPAGPPTKRPRM